MIYKKNAVLLLFSFYWLHFFSLFVLKFFIFTPTIVISEYINMYNYFALFNNIINNCYKDPKSRHHPVPATHHSLLPPTQITY